MNDKEIRCILELGIHRRILVLASSVNVISDNGTVISLKNRFHASNGEVTLDGHVKNYDKDEIAKLVLCKDVIITSEFYNDIKAKELLQKI